MKSTFLDLCLFRCIIKPNGKLEIFLFFKKKKCSQANSPLFKLQLLKKGNKYVFYFAFFFIGGCNETNVWSLQFENLSGKTFGNERGCIRILILDSIWFDLVFYQNHKKIKFDVHYHDFLKVRTYFHFHIPVQFWTGFWNLKIRLHIKKNQQW